MKRMNSIDVIKKPLITEKTTKLVEAHKYTFMVAREATKEDVKKAVEELGLDVEVEYITDMEKVMTYGVMSMPALVINEQVVSAGKALKPAEIIKLLKKLGNC